MENSKNDRIQDELNRINSFFDGVDKYQRANVAPLIQNAAFMKVTLEDLQEIINSEGVTEVYQNGANQKGIKPSATLQSYNSLIKNYTAVIKTLSNLLPEERVLDSWFTPRRNSNAEDEYVTEEDEEETEEDEVEAAKREAARREEEFKIAAEYQRQERENNYQGSFLQFRQQWYATHNS